MELRQYLVILRRAWWLVLGLPLLVAVLTVLAWLFGAQRYGSSAVVVVTQQPVAPDPAGVTLPDYNNFHSWAASEFIVDDLLQVVKTQRYVGDIVARVEQQHGVALDVELVLEGISAERKHRTVYLDFEASSADHVEWIAQAAVALLQEKGLEYWGRQNTAQLDVAVLQEPTDASRVGGIVALALDLVIRTLLALLLAVGIAFLRHYLDQTVHLRSDVEALGLDVVGTIPVAKGARG